jgi:hypothetical protein
MVWEKPVFNIPSAILNLTDKTINLFIAKRHSHLKPHFCDFSQISYFLLKLLAPLVFLVTFKHSSYLFFKKILYILL